MDRGHASLELALGVGLLLLPAAIAVLSFGPWSERAVAAEAIAAEATRVAVLELDIGAGNAEAGIQADRAGLDRESVRVGWCGTVPTSEFSGVCPLGRGTAVTVAVEIWTPLVSTPWGDVGGLWVSATHSEPIDLYRSLG